MLSLKNVLLLKPAAYNPSAPTPFSCQSGGNPFDPFGQGAGNPTDSEWGVSLKEQTNYKNIFATCNPVDGLVSGDAAKAVLLKSRLPVETLGKIWNLSDVDNDGYLDVDEVCKKRAMRLLYLSSLPSSARRLTLQLAS